LKYIDAKIINELFCKGYYMKQKKLEERMLVTVTVNLMHKMEDFQKFKDEQGISGDYEAKTAYLVEKFHMSDKTAENLLSGKVVSKNNYLAIFPSFDKDNINEKSTALERFAETIVDAIDEEDEDTITEVSNIITNKLEKLKSQISNLFFVYSSIVSLDSIVNFFHIISPIYFANL